MEEEKGAFYVVRKGNVVGVYKNLSDCQAQVGSSVYDPAVSLYKGYSLPKEADEYLVSRGLKDATYSISAVDVKEGLFGTLVPCPFQQPPSSKDKASNKASPPKRLQEVLELDCNVQPPSSKDKASNKASPPKRLQEVLELDGNVQPPSSKVKASNKASPKRLREVLELDSNVLPPSKDKASPPKRNQLPPSSKDKAAPPKRLQEVLELNCSVQPPSKDTASNKASPPKRLQEVLELDNNVQPPSEDKASNKASPPKRSQEVMELDSNVEAIGSTSLPTDALRKHVKLTHSAKAQAISSKHVSCILKFAGSSRGNPGQSGAGAVLRAEDGSSVCRLREGLGMATSNFAEYRALILGLKHARKKGFTRICVQGDSKLVCMQVQGLWKTKNENMLNLCKEAKELKGQFLSFQINHIPRALNSEAAAQATLALNIEDGQVQEKCDEK